jgi:hypothetical protein
MENKELIEFIEKRIKVLNERSQFCYEQGDDVNEEAYSQGARELEIVLYKMGVRS